MFDEKLLKREGEGKRNSPFLYFKNLENLENLETPTNDFSENEKPRNEADKIEAKSDFGVSRFLGFSNSENPENLENSEMEKFSKCSNCGLNLEWCKNDSLWFCSFGCESQKAG